MSSPALNNNNTSKNNPEDLMRSFHTALVSSALAGVECAPDKLEATLQELTRDPAYKLLLNIIGRLAREESISEVDAAKKLIQAFKKTEALWSGYVLSQGFERIKSLG